VKGKGGLRKKRVSQKKKRRKRKKTVSETRRPQSSASKGGSIKEPAGSIKVRGEIGYMKKREKGD